MSTTENKIPLAVARSVAWRFSKYLLPYCSRIAIAGSVRREVDYVGDIDIVCVAYDEFSMTKAFPEGYKGMVMNGSRLKRFKYPESGIQIELHITTIADYGRILAIVTGSSAYSHGLAMQWNRRGYAGTTDGLRLKRECDHKGNTWRIKPEYKIAPTLPPVFDTEEKFFEFIGKEWIEPQRRSWVSNSQQYNYKL
jgi:DNA polymerase/3'-5' exonuclease PolX